MEITAKILKLHLANGNTKLSRQIAVFNMGSATRCPSSMLGLCAFAKQVTCYALKAERQYPACLPYRDRQAELWQSTSAEAFASAFLAINARKRKRFVYLRLNEAGDFYGQACVDKAEKIAEILSTHGVQVYTYTHRRDLDYSGLKFLVLNTSNFRLESHNCFRALPKAAVEAKAESGATVCPGACGPCTLCMHRHGQTVLVANH